MPTENDRETANHKIDITFAFMLSFYSARKEEKEKNTTVQKKIFFLGGGGRVGGGKRWGLGPGPPGLPIKVTRSMNGWSMQMRM